MSQTKVMYQRPITRDAISLRPARQPHERMLRKSKSTRSETISKLKTAYSHAARAFLHHRIEEAHALVEEAFELLHPPTAQEHDPLSTYRRKWDILRITLETTLYTTPVSGSSSKRPIKLGSIDESSSSSIAPIPQSPNGSLSPRSKTPLIDDPLLLSPPSLLGTLHTRSLKLFTPSTSRPSSRFLPAPVLVALVLASLKLECPQVGRGMIDDWLANRESLGLGFDSEVQGEEREGYEKVIEVYSLHVLPRLNEWEYAKEFLESEMEMRPSKREELVATLAAHHAKSLLPPSPKPSQLHNIDNSVSGSSGAPTPRAVSPAPSSVSSHTAVPNSRSVATLLHNKSSLTSPSPLSPPSATTAREQRSANIASSSIVPTALSIPPPAPTLAAQSTPPAQPTVLQLLKAVLIPYIRRLNAPVVLLAIVLSFVGLATRFGRRPRGGSGADMARRRLAGGSGGIWAGLVDAVKMSGRGLV